MNEGPLHRTLTLTAEARRVFTAQLRGETLHLGTAQALDTPVSPGGVLTPEQAQTLASQLGPGQAWSLRGVQGGVQLLTWGKLWMTSLDDPDGKDHWVSAHVKGHHAALQALICRALGDEADARTSVPQTPEAPHV